MQLLLPFIYNHGWLSLIWLLLLCSTGFAFIKSGLSTVSIVDNHEAIQLINQKKAVVWDVRPHSVFSSGHITQARHITVDAIKDKQTVSLTPGKHAPIILVSEDGAQAMALAKLLHQQGLKQVRVLQDGMIGWNREQLPLITSKSIQSSVTVEIYTRKNCPYCVRAKELLAMHKATLQEIVIDGDEDKKQEMITRSGRTSVPQIFINQRHIGGCEDLAELDVKQQLAHLLQSI